MILSEESLSSFYDLLPKETGRKNQNGENIMKINTNIISLFIQSVGPMLLKSTINENQLQAELETNPKVALTGLLAVHNQHVHSKSRVFFKKDEEPASNLAKAFLEVHQSDIYKHFSDEQLVLATELAPKYRKELLETLWNRLPYTKPPVGRPRNPQCNPIFSDVVCATACSV